MRIKTSTILFIAGFAASAAPVFSATTSRKILVAIPYFELEGQVDQGYRKTLADTLQSAFERSGRISTKGEGDITQILKQTQENQTLGSACQGNADCIRSLAAKLQVGYIAQSRLTYLNGRYIASIRMIPYLADREIPTLQEEITDSNQIFSAVEKMATDITLMLPIEGAILAVANNDDVVIDLGASHGIAPGNEFFAIKETLIKNKKGTVVARNRETFGKIKIKTLNDGSSIATTKKGSGFSEGDIVLLDQEEIIARIEKERKKKQEKLEEERRKQQEKIEDEQRAALSRQNAAQRESNIRATNTRVKLGVGLSQMANSDLNKYYGNGISVMVDGIVQSTPYVDVYVRGIFKTYSMKDNYASLNTDTSKPDVVSKGSILQLGLDVGVQLKVIQGYFLYELWTVYIPLGMRMLYYSETAENKLKNNFLSFGLVGGVGLQITLTTNLGIFGEVNYGYTPVGGGLANSSSSSTTTTTTKTYNSANVEGLQWFAGLAVRF